MRTTLIAAVLLTAAVAGCTTAAAPQQSAAAPRPSKERVVVDTEKMAAVDRAARETGIAVHWVNPPVKRER